MVERFKFFVECFRLCVVDTKQYLTYELWLSLKH